MSVLDKSGHFYVLENQALTILLQLINTARVVNWNAPRWPGTAFGRSGKESKFTEHLYVILFNFHINSVKAGVAPPGNFLFIGFFLYSKFSLWKISNRKVERTPRHPSPCYSNYQHYIIPISPTLPSTLLFFG